MHSRLPHSFRTSDPRSTALLRPLRQSMTRSLLPSTSARAMTRETKTTALEALPLCPTVLAFSVSSFRSVHPDSLDCNEIVTHSICLCVCASKLPFVTVAKDRQTMPSRHVKSPFTVPCANRTSIVSLSPSLTSNRQMKSIACTKPARNRSFAQRVNELVPFVLPSSSPHILTIQNR